MNKIDKTLKEVRLLKKKIGAKTRGMSPKQVLAFFHSAQTELAAARRKPRSK